MFCRQKNVKIRRWNFQVSGRDGKCRSYAGSLWLIRPAALVAMLTKFIKNILIQRTFVFFWCIFICFVEKIPRILFRRNGLRRWCGRTAHHLYTAPIPKIKLTKIHNKNIKKRTNQKKIRWQNFFRCSKSRFRLFVLNFYFWIPFLQLGI